MLAWQLCDFPGIQTSNAKKPYIFVICFRRGGRGRPHMSSSYIKILSKHMRFWSCAYYRATTALMGSCRKRILLSSARAYKGCCIFHEGLDGV